MMKSINKKISVFSALTWTVTILALVFRILARLFAYDEEIGYFKSNSVLPILYYISLVLIVVLAFIGYLLFRKTKMHESVFAAMKETSVSEKIAAMIGTLAMLGVTIAMALIYWGNSILNPNGFTMFGVITALLSVFFFLLFWVPSARGKTVQQIFGIAFALHFMYTLCSAHFDLYTPLNSPVKLLVQLSAIASVIFIFSDLRFHMGGISLGRFLFATTPAIAFLTVSVLSGGMFSVYTEEFTLVYHICDLANLAVLCYVLVRYIRFLTLYAKADLNAEDDEKNSDTDVDEQATQDSDSSAEIPSQNEQTDISLKDQE